MQPLWEMDQSLFRAIHLGWHQGWLDPFFYAITLSGTEWVQFPLFLALFPWRRRWVPPLFFGWALASLVNTVLLKQVIARDRPSRLPWAHPQEQIFAHAFPSGHTALAFAAATILSILAARENRKWVAWTAYAWAILVGISRIYRGVHWPSDVLGGAFVGLLTGFVVTLCFRKPAESVECSVASGEGSRKS